MPHEAPANLPVSHLFPLVTDSPEPRWASVVASRPPLVAHGWCERWDPHWRRRGWRCVLHGRRSGALTTFPRSCRLKDSTSQSLPSWNYHQDYPTTNIQHGTGYWQPSNWCSQQIHFITNYNDNNLSLYTVSQTLANSMMCSVMRPLTSSTDCTTNYSITVTVTASNCNHGSWPKFSQSEDSFPEFPPTLSHKQLNINTKTDLQISHQVQQWISHNKNTPQRLHTTLCSK